MTLKCQTVKNHQGRHGNLRLIQIQDKIKILFSPECRSVPG